MGEITPRGVAVLSGLTTGSSTSLLFAKVASGENGTSRGNEVLWGEGAFLGAARDNGGRVESFLVGSPAGAGEIGAPTREAGTVCISFCVENFTNTEAGRFLGSSGTGRGETGISRVVVTWGAGSSLGDTGIIAKAVWEAESLLLVGPDELGGETQVATSKVEGAAEIVEGLVITSEVIPTEETGVSFNPGLSGEAGGIWATKGCF